ncbi:LLM class flavin-dependent oxidoreductase [Microbacterium hibisci]|uniref:LLM class flavin-dependent oxidoreductase n=1 Tax=Microbacterium hibisci TaxID=2036000 RepID=UPI001943014D|nr:LLM class flavin-dependent oxidoreductase [Microbacterium hibisci]
MAHKKKLRIGLAAYGTGWDLRAWRLPEANSQGLIDPSVIIDIARIAERGKLDYIFAGSALSAEPDALQRIHRWDSAVFAGYAAAITRNVGFLVSVNSSFEHPYLVARQIATLDNFSQGRAALNVVFGIDRAGRPDLNFGKTLVPDDDTKYARAREFTVVLNQLLHSWDRDFVLDDKANGVLVRPDSWRRIDFSGEFFEVRGPLNAPPPVQKQIPNVHVGTSDASLAYGADLAQVRFSPYFGLEEGREEYRRLKSLVAARGRDPETFKIIPGVTFYVGGTLREAREKFREIERFQVTTQIPAAYSRAFGVDLAGVSEDEKVLNVLSIDDVGPDSLTQLVEEDARGRHREGQPRQNGDDRTWLREVVFDTLGDEDLTLGELYRFTLNHRYAQGALVGDAQKISNWLETHLEAEALDGVQLFPPYHRGPADAFVDLVIPELQRRGIFRTEYESTTLEGNLGTTPDDVDPRLTAADAAAERVGG